ncbi:MAG TPA: outer membrane protein transport protein, partial [Polyangiaceae bacterium]
WQLLDPVLGVAANLGRLTPAAADFSAALTLFAPPGVGKLEFPLAGGQRYMMLSREAQIITTAGTLAWQLDDVLSLGVSLHWLYLKQLDYELVIDARTMQGANPVTSPTDVLSRVSGSDPFALNAVIGAWYRAAPFLEIGLAGQIIPTSFKTKSTLEIEGLSPEFGDISLTRDGEPARDVSVELPLPLSARAGVRYLHPDAARTLFDVELDVVYETWSRVERFAMDTRGLSASWRDQSIDIGHIDIEKHWQNTWGLHLGGDYHLLQRATGEAALSVRGGVYFESAVAERAYSHVDFSGGEQLGGALGASLYLGALELAVAYEQRRQPRVTVHEPDARVYQEVPQNPCGAPYDSDRLCHPEYLGQPSPAVNAGSYRAVSHMLSLEALYEY